MIYDFWWDTGGRSSHFLADINAPESVVNRMAEEYNEHTRTISFVTFLRIHNVPARSINPVEVEFYPKEEKRREIGLSWNQISRPALKSGRFRKKREHNNSNRKVIKLWKNQRE